MSRVVVVGAGVLGLTVAHESAVAGHRVHVVADRAARDSVSAVAAAIWFPHAVALEPDVLESGRATYERLTRLADDPATGVFLRAGLVRVRRAETDLSWTSAVPRHERVAEGVRCVVPVVETSRYLAWLGARVAALGVTTTWGTVQVPGGQGAEALTAEVASIIGEQPDAVVVAAGLGSGALLGGDAESYPIRGQVVRLANPGLTEWVTDEDNPGGLTYVVPRTGDVVCGGTGQVGDWDETIDPATEEAILRRVRKLVPALADQLVLSRAVGLRPARTNRRLERIGDVIACYGHGGSGFTLSWGDAARVTQLLG
ncbi:FAD-dependent oxidoreductase [Actinoplanes regularis]|uniref:D-amino-acid oxidase n=1 Tax=Actinoplanes regularis TaxID=52697 RepID=A0A238W6C5_9ACTN|nr:FAD-dependent oxidoreductase [Actinoplanes regularis]SNR41733.1 D-amino-acid:oxygen oxidoreductase [Actinoplanes regularis]